MLNKKIKLFIYISLLLLSSFTANTQGSDPIYTIQGFIEETTSGETIPFASISIKGTTKGTIANSDGYYSLNLKRHEKDTLIVSYLGYNKKSINIEYNGEDIRRIDFKLKPNITTLNEVTIKSEKGAYKNKDNPAVMVMKHVIQNKSKNQKIAQDYLEYDQYEKIQLDLINLSKNFLDKGIVKKLPFLKEYIDTTGKPIYTFLPFFLRETSSKIYERSDPQSKKEYRKGVKMVGVQDYIDQESVSNIMDYIYQDINIYSNSIEVLGQQLPGPLSIFGPNLYRYFLLDTIEIEHIQCYKIGCYMRNKQDPGFQGEIFVSLDSNYRVIKYDLFVSEKANLNFVEDLRITQTFSQQDTIWVKGDNETTAKLKLDKDGLAIRAKRTVFYNNYKINLKRRESIYSSSENVIDDNDMFEKGELFWKNARIKELTPQEEAIYEMIDTLGKVPTIKRAIKLVTFLLSGYHDVGLFEVGPFHSFYTFNEAEGLRLRFGGRTTYRLHNKAFAHAYGTRTFGNKGWLYAFKLGYSFNDRFDRGAKHFLSGSYIKESRFPGVQLKFVDFDTFWHSIRRGSSSRKVLYNSYQFNYVKEFKNHITLDFDFVHQKQTPIGDLTFDYYLNDQILHFDNIKTSELGLGIRFAPNEEFIQGKNIRKNFYNKSPIITLNGSLGVKDLFESDYEYHRLSLNIFKRFYFSSLGYADLEVENGKIWGNVPYLLLHLPDVNQSFALKKNSYNLMNFMEFVSDEYIEVMGNYYMNGFLFNKVPVFKKLKWREVFGFKALWGNLSDQNNPNISDNLLQFARDDNGQIRSFPLEEVPYLEASVGVTNIFKIFRMDALKRFTYLDHPSMPTMFNLKGFGLRVRTEVTF